MWTTILILICAAIIARGAWGGYRAGAAAHLVTLASVGFAYLAAALVFLSKAELPAGPIPRLLQPFVLGGVTGAVVFLVLSLLGQRWLRGIDRRRVEEAREAGEEAPQKHTLRNAAWNRRLGLTLGALEGGVLAAVLFFSVHYIGLWTIASEPVLASVPSRPAVDPERPAPPAPAPAPAPDPTPFHTVFRSVGEEMRRSPIGRAADAVAPVKTRHVELAGKLTQLASDERNLKRFTQNESVQRLMNHPPLVRLARDPSIQKALQEKRWADLMNDPQILALIHDQVLMREIRGIDLEGLFSEVGETPVPDDPIASRQLH